MEKPGMQPHEKAHYERPPPYTDNSMRNVLDPQSDPAYGYGGYPHGYVQGQNTHNNVVVLQPGMVAPEIEPYEDVPDYLVLSIISILFCTCLGIFSIVKASNARQMKAAGRYRTAKADAVAAKNSAIAGIVVGAILTGIFIGIRVSLQA